mmetsp:Transcript_21432/g.24899  ORF Transcript_21432/g.24899 Transcript_21432/m.24899 type:complete len:148 (-) Transcript_21432:304-747(-)
MAKVAVMCNDAAEGGAMNHQVAFPDDSSTTEFLTNFYSIYSDVAGCLDCFFCSCCFAGRQRAALYDNPDSISWPTCICACPLFTFPCISLSLRRHAKEKYQLREGGGTTCVIGCLLWPLSLCQVMREVGLRDVDAGGTCCKTTPSLW